MCTVPKTFCVKTEACILYYGPYRVVFPHNLYFLHRNFTVILSVTLLYVFIFLYIHSMTQKLNIVFSDASFLSLIVGEHTCCALRNL